MASIEQLAPKVWRVRWREGGRGGKQRTSARFHEKHEAVTFLRQLEGRLAAALPSTDSRLLSWVEVVNRWHATRPEGEYRDKARDWLVGLPWQTVADATPAAIRALRPLYGRYVSSVLHWALSDLEQPVSAFALAARPATRPKRPRKPLTSDSDVASLVARCREYGAHQGAIAHLLATYGHRAQSVVRLTANAVKGGELYIRVKGGDLIRHALLPESIAILEPLILEAQSDANRPKMEDHNGEPSPCLFLDATGDKPWPNGQRWAAWFYGEVSRGLGYYDAFKRPAITAMLDHVDATTVAAITGHRTVSMLLDRYSRTNEARQSEALSAIASRACSLGAPAKIKNS